MGRRSFKDNSRDRKKGRFPPSTYRVCMGCGYIFNTFERTYNHKCKDE